MIDTLDVEELTLGIMNSGVKIKQPYGIIIKTRGRQMVLLSIA